MASVPMKSEYGPTLGTLLAPRWWAASRAVRVFVVLAGLALAGGAIGLALTLENAHYVHGGRLPFSFSYRSLFRAHPDRGALVKIIGKDPHGAVRYSYEVYPLHLPPYSGGLSGELPRYASGYIQALASSQPEFSLSGEGKTRVNNVPAYQVLYTTALQGKEMYGRNVLIAPEHPGAREGVVIAMLTDSKASSQIKAPSEVASTGVLLRPLKTFTFG